MPWRLWFTRIPQSAQLFSHVKCTVWNDRPQKSREKFSAAIVWLFIPGCRWWCGKEVVGLAGARVTVEPGPCWRFLGSPHNRSLTKHVLRSYYRLRTPRQGYSFQGDFSLPVKTKWGLEKISYLPSSWHWQDVADSSRGRCWCPIWVLPTQLMRPLLPKEMPTLVRDGNSYWTGSWTHHFSGSRGHSWWVETALKKQTSKQNLRGRQVSLPGKFSVTKSRKIKFIQS